MTTIELIELSANLATAIGLPLALLGLAYQWRVEIKAKEYESYNSLDEKYNSFIELCLQWPELRVYDPNREKETWSTLNYTDLRRQQMLYQILISILERAYLMYRNKSSKIRRQEFKGWLDYMKDYASIPDFQYAWNDLKLGEQFHEEFVLEINKLINSSKSIQLLHNKY